MRRSAFFRASVVTLALSSCFIFGANAKQTREVGEPEAATGYIEKKAFEELRLRLRKKKANKEWLIDILWCLDNEHMIFDKNYVYRRPKDYSAEW